MECRVVKKLNGVVTAAVPWAEPGSGFTALIDRHLDTRILQLWQNSLCNR